MSGYTKLWVRRPNSSPTRIQIPSSVSTPLFSPTSAGAPPETTGTSPRDGPRPVEIENSEDFLVDDLRELILRKYPQSLGRHHDAADLSIRIPPRRDERQDGDTYDPNAGRILAPDESVIKILTEEYPDGQKSSEAWTIITSGGRDSYTRWWLQNGGLSTDVAVRGGYSPNYFIPSTGGSFGGSERGQHPQEYFPIVPETVVTPPGEYPLRSRNSGSSMMSAGQYSRSSARPSLRTTRGLTQEALFQHRRYDNTNTSSMVVEAGSGPGSEQGRLSPDATSVPNLRYPSVPIRPGSGISGRATPPSEYSGRVRQYTQSAKGPPSASSQGFNMQLPQQTLPTIPQKATSPLGGPPQQRLSVASSSRPAQNMSNGSPSVPPEKPQIPVSKTTTSPKSPSGGSSSTSGGGTKPISPVGRKKSNTISAGSGPLPKPRSPSPQAERTETPRPTRPLPLVKSKEKDTVPKNSSIGVIPPINVLIVEDNIINAQILEVFFRKRKLKYATAVNGKEAVEKWRQGGWHLVLLPVMSGIEATKEIRRLERVNRIGIFSEETTDKPSPEDELGDLPFPSPVIIVALTASSRESDRNEALAAGCNDFLTKPVGAPWLERKAIEWGCMQALIWTSFERKKKREVQKEADNGELNDEGKGSLGIMDKREATVSPEKPPVERGDSGDSVNTQTSLTSEEGQSN